MSEKEELYSNLNMEDITGADYIHWKRVSKDSKIKNLGEYQNLYLKSDTLLLADVFENFRKMCVKIYHLDPVKCISAAGLAWQAALKNIEVELELLTDTDMLLMLEKGIRRGIRHAIHWYAKANNKYMKDYDKNKEPLYLKYWGVNNLYGWAMLQELPVNLRGLKILLNLMKISYKVIMKKVMKNIFQKLILKILEVQYGLNHDLTFLHERMKVEKVEKLVANLHDRNEYVIHIRNLKQAVNHRLILKNVHRVINFNR